MEILRSAWVYNFDCEQLRHTHTPWEGQEERGGGGDGGRGGKRGGRSKEERGRRRGAEKERTRGKNCGENIDQTCKHGFRAANMACKIFGCVSNKTMVLPIMISFSVAWKVEKQLLLETVGWYIALTPTEGKHVGDIGRTSNLLICGLPTKGANFQHICTHNQLPKGVLTSEFCSPSS